MDWLKFHHRLLIGLLTAGLVYGCAPVGLTSQPSTEATPTLSLHTPVTDCPANLVHDSSSQAGYREWLFPGLTSREEVEERLGEPDSRGLYNRVWYEESEEDHYTFLQIQYTDGIATSLMTNDTGLSLGQALEMYGCPDFIYGTWSSEHGFGPFVVDTVSIIYLDAGVLVSLPTPFDINSPLDLLEAFLPTPLETLIESHQHLDHPGNTRALSFSFLQIGQDPPIPTPSQVSITPIRDCPWVLNLGRTSTGLSSYQGLIVPGSTTEQELLDLFGQPTRATEDTLLFLEPQHLDIRLNEGVVTLVSTRDPGLSIEDVFNLYGCPDYIFASRSTESGPGDFVVDKFHYVYINPGIHITTNPWMPITSPVELMEWFSPGSLSDVYGFFPLLGNSILSRAVTFSEALNFSK